MSKNLELRKLQFATQAIHAGYTPDPLFGAVMPPIVLSSTFAQKSPAHPVGEYEYSRTHNPTRTILQNNLAILEKAQHGFCFASGCAALSTLLQTLPPDSEVILSDDVYGGTHRLFAKVYEQNGIRFTLTDLTHAEELPKLLTAKTRLIWLETPSNPLLKVIDISKISAIKEKHAPLALLGVDNTFASPFLQNPLILGADIVLHSSTKYISGHSDVVGGVLLLNDKELADKIAFLQNAIGAVPSPFDCYLLSRSLKTLHLRMQAHCHNAQIIAEFLDSHPKVKKVHYPGLTSHPQHEVAVKQMRAFGGMVSIVLQGNESDAFQFLQRLKIFTLAESLGGVESLVEHPASMTHAAIPAEHRIKIGIEDTLVRLSVGVEAAEDLVADLKFALDFQ